ncbi:MAG: AmmeMemoRadiSam system protein B [Promethearchaeota archaeon]|nr:MAG: AmmeMemoRadiSam system protein B [Candidatus Lokiarchaeota archaeon]
MVIRRAEYAGSWYSGKKSDLIKALERYFSDKNFGPGELPKKLGLQSRTIIGGVSPHAGHEYSGPCAAFTYLNLFKEKIPDTIIILGTDHRGYRKIALFEEGEWETPLGNLKVDNDLSKKILDKSEKIINDNSAFLIGEHNIEIQLPFIKFCAQDTEVKIVPIKITPRTDFKIMDEISSDIADIVKNEDKDIVIVASSDMSHEQILNEVQLKKFKAIDQAVISGFEKLDAKATLDAALKTSVCGPQTITTLVLIGKKLNASNGKLLKYYTSAERTGSLGGYCVGYFSGVIIK